MKKKLFHIFILLCTLSCMCTNASAQDGTWRIYASYHNVSKAVKAGERVFAIADGSLMCYDAADESVVTYDKSNVLSDFGIKDIAYCEQSKTLVVLYANGNVNLLDMDENSWCLPELKNKVQGNISIKEMRVFGNEAYICSSAGLTIVDVKKHYFAGHYDLGGEVQAVAVVDNVIYAKTANGYKSGDRTKNLLDPAQWQSVSAPQGVTFGPTAEEKTAEAELVAKMKEVKIDSPARNLSYKLNMIDERLLVAGGNFYFPDKDDPGMALKYEDGRWTQFDEEGPLALMGKDGYMNVTEVVQDPADTEHHWLGTMRSGIYEFRDYKMVKHYDYRNSPITSILPDCPHPDWYTRVVGLNFDRYNNLWMLNTECDTIVRVLGSDNRWHSLYFSELDGNPTFSHVKFDRRGWAWINSRRTFGTHLAGLLILDYNGTVGTASDDKHVFINEFRNQDGTQYMPIFYNDMTEDLGGAVWIGTDVGLFVSFDPEELMNGGKTLTQVKVPRGDGTNLADYLLANIEVTCITVDGANRKWIGTRSNGVYLVSADGVETIHHFTKADSPLISDNINDIAINGTTGEVFIATTEGLCSYMGDATDAAADMKTGTLKVFPNPVRPEYSGDVHITGLMENSVVKIVNAAGRLVAEGQSNGGMYRWNCRTAAGRHVSAGVYYVLATDEEGNKGAVAKVLVVR